MKILVIDNYDSFVYNLVQILKDIPEVDVTVTRNDQLDLEHLKHFDGILLSPGPGIPQEAGQLMQVIKRYVDTLPILGVCLGHQALAEHFGGILKNLPTPLHGIASALSIEKEGTLFQGLPQKFNVGHYHSWIVDEVTDELEVIAKDEKNQIMAIQHKNLPVYGVQFHPESVMTEYGKEMIENWVEVIKNKVSHQGSSPFGGGSRGRTLQNTIK